MNSFADSKIDNHSAFAGSFFELNVCSGFDLSLPVDRVIFELFRVSETGSFRFFLDQITCVSAQPDQSLSGRKESCLFLKLSLGMLQKNVVNSCLSWFWSRSSETFYWNGSFVLTYKRYLKSFLNRKFTSALSSQPSATSFCWEWTFPFCSSFCIFIIWWMC